MGKLTRTSRRNSAGTFVGGTSPFAVAAPARARLVRAARQGLGLAPSRVEPLEARLLFSTYVVNTNADSGAGSLRDAILQSNANPGADTIQFNLAAGQTTIAPTSALPVITDALTIDGTSQPGYAGAPLVEISGNLAGSSAGLVVHSSNVTISGLAIYSFTLDGIDFSNPSATTDVLSVTITGNYIGTDVTGELAMGNGGSGINLSIPQQNISSVLVTGNVISANQGSGIYVNNVTASTFAGNRIGTDATGTRGADANGKSFGNFGSGITVAGTSNGDTFGGASLAQGNVISNNLQNGISLQTSAPEANLIDGNSIGVDATGTLPMGNGLDGIHARSDGGTIQGNVIGANQNGLYLSNQTTLLDNFVGTNAAGATNLGNQFDGVYITGSNNTIGQPGDANVIAYNGAAGPQAGNGVTVSAGTGNSIRGNAIFANSWNEIDLNNDGPTPNSSDPTMHAGMPNNFQNYPVLDPIASSAGGVTLAGSLSADPNTTYSIDFYSSDVGDGSGFGPAKTFLGTATVTTDGAGNASFSQLFSNVPANQMVFTATATDPNGNTSEFAADVFGPAPTTTAITLNGSNFQLGQVVSITVTVSAAYGFPGGVVELFDGQTSLVNLTLDANGTAQFTDSVFSAGSHTLYAYYQGAGAFNGSTGSASFNMSQDTTTTTLTTPASSLQFGQTLMLSASVPPAFSTRLTPGGTINFFDGTTLLGSQSLNVTGNASFNVLLSGGTHNLSAVYSGDSNFSGSTSNSASESVNLEATSTALAAISTVLGQSMLLSAAVTFPDLESIKPTGLVDFIENGAVIGSGTLDATGHAIASVTLGIGAHSITASYLGDGNYLPSASVAASDMVKPEPTTLALTPALPISFGQTVTFTAAVSFADAESVAPTGTVTFSDGTTILGSGLLDASGHATLTVKNLLVGIHPITATFSGDANFGSSTSSEFDETVNKANSTTALTTSASTVNAGQAVTFTASVLPAGSTGSVAFYDGTTLLQTVALSSGKASITLSTLAAGTHAIQAIYSGDASYNGSNSATVTETVQKVSTAPVASHTTLVASNATATLGQMVMFTATVTSSAASKPTGVVTFHDGTTVLGTALLLNGTATFTTSTLALGAHSISANYGGDAADLASTSSAVSLMISAPATGSVAAHQTQSSNFWSTGSGLALLLNLNGSFLSTSLGNWLSSTFPNLFGAHSQYFNLTNASNLQVAIDVQLANFFAPKVWSDMLTTAMDVYASSSALGGSSAAAYGFAVSTTGLGGATVNVGSAGSAFGLANNSTATVFDLLRDADAHSPSGSLFMGNNASRNQADTVFAAILKAGK